VSFLERARVQRERQLELESRLALAGYLVARLTARALGVTAGVDAETLESLRWQRESTRRYLEELPAERPEVAHLSGIIAATEPAPRSCAPALNLSLTAYAYFLEHEGRFEEALDVLALAEAAHIEPISAPEYIRLALTAARLHRLLARWDRATGFYATASEAAAAAGDRAAVLRGRLGQAAVLRGRGNLPAARQEVEAVLCEAEAEARCDIACDAWLDLGAICGKEGRRFEALDASYQAFRRCEDPLQQMRILGDLGVALLEVGAQDAARVALDIVAGSQASFTVRLNATLELLDLESQSGNRLAFERRRQAAAAAAERMPPSMALDFAYKTGVGFVRFGMLERGRRQLEDGLRMAETHRLNDWYFRLEAVLANLDGCAAPQAPAIAEPLAEEHEPAVWAMAAGLRAFAGAAD
jgi:tetratricopeptide (TPR) repeat protein